MNEVFLCVGCAIGHTCHWTHLRCEGSKGSKGSACLWQAGSKGGGGALRAQIIKKGARPRRGLCRRVASLRSGGDSSSAAEGGGGALRAQSFISRLRRSRQHRVSILSAYLVHPFPLRGTSPRWEACHWIRGSRGSPMNPVPLPPQGETRALRDWPSVSYSMISTLVISRCAAPPYPAAPDFPPSGGQN